ncbi:MAG: RNA polymerase sigma factor [Peptococcaceae bacterium]|nr:RNA polymerase sigma factor [Peptococcaceae bacterium]
MDQDAGLIKKIRQGDAQAAEAFVRKYYADMLRYCTFHCTDRSEAEDLTQEVFEGFFAHLSRYRHQGKAKHYLYTIAANCCHNAAARRRSLPMEAQTLTALADAAAPTEMAASDRLALRWALDALATEQREVIILYYYQGLKQREIAKVLDIGLPLVKYRLRQGRAQLARLLEEGEDES